MVSVGTFGAVFSYEGVHLVLDLGAGGVGEEEDGEGVGGRGVGSTALGFGKVVLDLEFCGGGL